MSFTAPTDQRDGSRRIVAALAKFVMMLLVIVAGLAGVWLLMKQKAAGERAEWKDAALTRLAALSITDEMIRAELDDTDWGWTHDHVLSMTNGECIIYASRHGANNGFVDHLFLGNGSDGRWLYSTYHFCNSMAMIRGDDPPGSIDEFTERYSVREFDGKSDDCLQHTWP